MIKRRHECRHNGCHELVKLDQDYCAKHQGESVSRSYNQLRKLNDGERTAFYHSAVWNRMREYIKLRDQGLCQVSLDKGLIVPGEIVDHKVPTYTQWGWEHRLDENNLQLISREEHNRKTAAEKQKYRREI
ncbi:MAG: hypothetical protein ACE3JK_01120 [Sporolactobacillus sp.]